jgi:hypothetical protein
MANATTPNSSVAAIALDERSISGSMVISYLGEGQLVGACAGRLDTA